MEIVETAAKPDSNYTVKKSSLSADRVKMDVKFSHGSFPPVPIFQNVTSLKTSILSQTEANKINLITLDY